MDFYFSKLKKKAIGVWRTSSHASQQAARSTIIIFTERIIIKIIYFIRTIILARLLFPDDFGLFGMATLAMNILGVISHPGFSSAIVQADRNIKKHLDSAWTVFLIRNIILSIILFFAAPLAGDFFNNQNVVPFTRALSLVYLISGFESLGTILLQKEMRFNRLFIFDVSGVIAEVCVSVASALILKNAWALLLGVIANKIVITIISYFLHSYKPRLNFDLTGAKHFFKFGKWIGLGGIISFLLSQGDNLIVGKILGASALGFYQLAFSLGTLPAVEIARAIGNVLFPLYSRLQEDVGLLKSAFIKINRSVFAVIIPAVAGLLVLAPEIIKIVYGQRWVPMTPIVYVIAVYGLIKSFDFLASPLLLGRGRAKAVTLIQIIQGVIMGVLIMPLTWRFGPVGAGFAVLASLLGAQIVQFIKIRKEAGFKFHNLLAIISLPFFASLIMSSIILLGKGVLLINGARLLAFYIIGGAAIYFISLFVLDKLFGRHFIDSLIWIKRNL